MPRPHHCEESPDQIMHIHIYRQETRDPTKEGVTLQRACCNFVTAFSLSAQPETREIVTQIIWLRVTMGDRCAPLLRNRVLRAGCHALRSSAGVVDDFVDEDMTELMTAMTYDADTDLATDESQGSQFVAHYLIFRVPLAGSWQTAGDARVRLVGFQYEDASHVFVLADGRRLVGVAAIRDVLAAPAETPLMSIARDAETYRVAPNDDREAAASRAIHGGLSILAVCDGDGRLLGAVPARALMTILRDEHLEDLHHMAGILGKSEAAKSALTAAPHRRAFYRLPWLLVGMAGSALATAMMARYEAALAAHIAVAFFIPAIVYLADSIGTQSEVVVVRGLSLTDSALLPLFLGELGTGALLGVMLGALAFPFIWFFFSSAGLAATVAISLAVASTIATTFGFLMPWTFARLGYDAALGSGPVATVVQDTFSLLTYFVVASLLVF